MHVQLNRLSTYLVNNLCPNLLGLPAILALNLVVRVAEVSEDYSSVRVSRILGNGNGKREWKAGTEIV